MVTRSTAPIIHQILSCFNPAFNKAQIEILFWHSCFSGLLLCHHIATWWKHLHSSGIFRSDHFYFSRARSTNPCDVVFRKSSSNQEGAPVSFRGWNYGEKREEKLHVIGADLLIWCFNRPKLMFRNKIPKNTLQIFFFNTLKFKFKRNFCTSSGLHLLVPSFQNSRPTGKKFCTMPSTHFESWPSLSASPGKVGGKC